MARSFARSISFPLSPSRSSKPPPSCHARSVSLPCRSHPILAHLHTHIRAVRAWAQQGLASASSSVAAGLAHVEALHAALGDLLDLPEAQAALSGAGAASDRMLDAFLRLADAHGCFQESVVALKQDVAEALTAVRRRDGARLASAVRSQRRAGKELARLAVAARECAVRPSRLSFMGGAAEAEVSGLLMESAAATASASAALFGTVAAMSASVASVAAESCSCKRTAALVCLVKTKKKSRSGDQVEEEETMGAVAERLEELEECIEELEAGSEKVFRSLVQTRVALLNIHTLHIF
ncbi:uncharacterized protein LOC124662315 [Lolium rigidum]|uniref:uncharacterized protein LOC124662315 n=1 Tax=Lolium rigidum TaxID=89674 RepID=UPI001F5DC2AB|nr:uncharacterized protein LOC124662315 [Lolium rigidum]